MCERGGRWNGCRAPPRGGPTRTQLRGVVRPGTLVQEGPFAPPQFLQCWQAWRRAYMCVGAAGLEALPLNVKPAHPRDAPHADAAWKRRRGNAHPHVRGHARQQGCGGGQQRRSVRGCAQHTRRNAPQAHSTSRCLCLRRKAFRKLDFKLGLKLGQACATAPSTAHHCPTLHHRGRGAAPRAHTSYDQPVPRVSVCTLQADTGLVKRVVARGHVVAHGEVTLLQNSTKKSTAKEEHSHTCRAVEVNTRPLPLLGAWGCAHTWGHDQHRRKGARAIVQHPSSHCTSTVVHAPSPNSSRGSPFPPHR